MRELPSASFVHVDPSMRNRITTLFNGRPINALTATFFELYNEGSEHIQNATVTVTLPVETIVLQATVLPRDCEPRCDFGSDNRVTVSLPYVNPFREHKQLLRLFVLADGETRHAKINGSGEGWSVRYVPLPGPKQIRKSYMITGAVGLVVGWFSYSFLRYVLRMLRVGPRDTLKALLAFMAVVGCITVGAWILHRAGNLGYRRFRG